LAQGANKAKTKEFFLFCITFKNKNENKNKIIKAYKYK
jgi:hypothetical protein